MSYKRISPQPVVEGGTGAITLTSHGVLLGNTTSAITATAAGTTGTVLTGVTGSAPVFASPAASSISLTGNSGGALTGNAFTIRGTLAASGSSVTFAGSGTTLTLTNTDANSNTYIGAASGNGVSGSFNAALGTSVLTAVSSNENVAVGSSSLRLLTSGTQNNALGTFVFEKLLTGAQNIGLGSDTGNTYTSSESHNILLNSDGVITDSHTMRIGNGTGTGLRELNKVYINGIYGISSSTDPQVMVVSTDGKITSISSSTAGFVLTSNGTSVPTFQSPGAPVLSATAGKTVTWTGANLNVTDASENTLIGLDAGPVAAITGNSNTALGFQAGRVLAAGNANILIGDQVAGGLTDGSFNIIIGYLVSAGVTTENSNVYINANGVGGVSNCLRIGRGSGTLAGQLTTSFISGIYGVTTASGTTSTVLVANDDQLGTVASSARFKNSIEDMANSSSAIMKTRPVCFQYNAHKDGIKQYGLIAEEVMEIMPEIVNLDAEGKPFTVRYHDMVPMLLNELQKLRKEFEDYKKENV